jgi:hypothetical protein
MKRHLRVSLLGLALGLVSGWAVGCTNHRGYTVSPAEAAAIQKQRMASQTQNGPSSEALSVSGHWACDDSQCDPDTIKTISSQVDQIQTEATERHSSPSGQGSGPEQGQGINQGICRIRETSRIAVSSQGNNTLSGNLNPGLTQVLDSPENTADCESYYEAQNGNLRSITDSVVLILNSSSNCPGKLSINGVCYRSLSDQALQNLESARTMKDAVDASVAGVWASAENDKSVLQATISSNRKSIVLDRLMSFPPGNEKCRMQKTSSLELENAPESDPDRFAGIQSDNQWNLVPSVLNADDCSTLAENLVNKPAAPATITFERDGTRYLLINGQRFVRKSQS